MAHASNTNGAQSRNNSLWVSLSIGLAATTGFLWSALTLYSTMQSLLAPHSHNDYIRQWLRPLTMLEAAMAALMFVGASATLRKSFIGAVTLLLASLAATCPAIMIGLAWHAEFNLLPVVLIACIAAGVAGTWRHNAAHVNRG